MGFRVKAIRDLLLLGIVCQLTLFIGCSSSDLGTVLPPPLTQRVEQDLSQHNVIRKDDFHWLSQKDQSEVLGQIKRENAYAIGMLARLAQEHKEQGGDIELNLAAQSPCLLPQDVKGWSYRFQKQGQGLQPLLVRTKEKAVEVVFDSNRHEPLAGHPVSLVSLSPNPDGRSLLLTLVDSVTQAHSILWVELASQATITVPGGYSRGDAVWDRNGTGFYFVRIDAESRAHELMKASFDKGKLLLTQVFRESDDTRCLTIRASESGSFLIVENTDRSSREVGLMSLHQTDPSLWVVIPRSSKTLGRLDHQNGKYFLLSNHEHPNFGVYSSSDVTIPLNQWSKLVSPQEEVRIHRAHYPKEFVVLEELYASSQRIRSVNLLNSEQVILHTLSLDKRVRVQSSWVSDGTIQLVIESPIQPPQGWLWDLIRMNKSEIPFALDPPSKPKQRHQVDHLLVTTPDGTGLPMTLFRSRESLQNGQQSMVLWVASGRGDPDPYGFNPAWSVFLDKGIGLAIVYINESGRFFPDTIRLGNKTERLTMVNNLISCAEFLVNQRWVHPDRLGAIAFEESAWALGAALNQRPSLFRCLMLESPITDPIQLLMDQRHPLGATRLKEWGYPAEPRDFDLLARSSPYDQLEPKDYPVVLIASAVENRIVPYWQGLKWGSKLRLMNTSDMPLLMVIRGSDVQDRERFKRLEHFKAQFLMSHLSFN